MTCRSVECTPILNIFRHLEGKWKILRTVSTFGTLQGFATFRKIDQFIFSYREEGNWTYATGKVSSAYKEYSYEYNEDLDQISVYLKETPKKLLHSLMFDHSNQTATGLHCCVFDQYVATYDFISENEFKLLYKVTGPNKDYTIETIFTKSERSEEYIVDSN